MRGLLRRLQELGLLRVSHGKLDFLLGKTLLLESTSVERIPNASFGIALENPNASALAFSGFGALNAVVPFDRARPPATITARARMTTGNVQVNYEKNGMPPPSPVKAEDCNGTAFDVELVPMAHTHLRLTVLPVLENAIGA